VEGEDTSCTMVYGRLSTVAGGDAAGIDCEEDHDVFGVRWEEGGQERGRQED